ncbi:EF-hand domain-containing protein [Roseomonas chloroacetimidivorans]|uniref:EF-hand domain-containing protein n=1 Tax=Roseomonas chloroacetimidivorans TaxID=1766656 RepID=UPI003C71E5E3
MTPRKLTLAALTATLGLGALGVPAMAQPAMPRGGQQLFRHADTNHDGRVTAEEAWSTLSARFGEADANKDGGVTWDEFRSYVQAQMEAHRGKRPAPPAAAQARMEQRGQGFFRALDADRDGRVTLVELRPFADAMFRARDANADNVLTRDEVRPHRARAARPARPQQAPAQEQAPTQQQ